MYMRPTFLNISEYVFPPPPPPAQKKCHEDEISKSNLKVTEQDMVNHEIKSKINVFQEIIEEDNKNEIQQQYLQQQKQLNDGLCIENLSQKFLNQLAIAFHTNCGIRPSGNMIAKHQTNSSYKVSSVIIIVFMIIVFLKNTEQKDPKICKMQRIGTELVITNEDRQKRHSV